MFTRALFGHLLFLSSFFFSFSCFIFFKIFELFHEIHYYSFKICVLGFIKVIFIGKHFFQIGFGKEATGLIFHIACAFVMIFVHRTSVVHFISDMPRVGWANGEGVQVPST